MRNARVLICAVICLFAVMSADAQAGKSTRRMVLPNPQLIHCHSAECSQLWKQDSSDSGAIYPAQIMTDLVRGEVVGLTAIYDKSVTASELRAVIEALYGKSTFDGVAISGWRVESQQFAVSISEGVDGAKQVTYLKFGTPASLVPTAHVDCGGK
jgi:N-acetyl-gamma-glutamylphosphate reductase